MRVYKTIFEVKVKHNYYVNKVCTDIDFFPTRETRLFLKKHHLLFKAGLDGFQIIRQYKDLNGVLSPFIEITENFSLKFNMNFKSKVFFNYTNLQFFDSRIKSLALKHKIGINQKFTQLIVDDQFVLPVYYRNMRVNDCRKKLRILDSDLSPVLEVVPDTATEYIDIDIKHIAPGLYFLEVDDTFTMQFIHNESYSIQPVGMLEVFMDIYNLMETDHKLEVVFDSREILWKYVLQKKFTNLDKLQIIDERGEYEFLEAETYEQETDVRREFISHKEIPFLQKNNLIFKVVRKTEGQNNEKVIIEKLPYPDIHNINVDETQNGGKVFTSIFVLI
jgi:hypothetical protein